MATTRRRKRPTKKNYQPKPGKESWLIVDPDGQIIRETSYGEGASVALAQTLAQKYHDEVTLTVRWKALFGEPDDLFRVTRDADGVIYTTPL